MPRKPVRQPRPALNRVLLRLEIREFTPAHAFGRLEGSALGHQLEDICAHACNGDADAVETATAVAWSALGISLPTNSIFAPARA